MQIKLLQKIEELTLYMIEQDKRYNDLKKENEAIKQELNELKKEQLLIPLSFIAPLPSL